MKIPDREFYPGQADPMALVSAAALALALTVFSLLTDWLAKEVTVPLGFLLLVFALIVLPTGEILGVVTAYLNRRKRRYKRERGGSQTKR